MAIRIVSLDTPDYDVVHVTIKTVSPSSFELKMGTLFASGIGVVAMKKGVILECLGHLGESPYKLT